MIFTCMVLLWLLSLRLRNASIVDIFWGMGFVIMTGVYWAVSPAGTLWRKGLLSLLVAIWGVRLSLHIFFRNRGKGEDFRYRRWREEAGNAWWWQSFFKVFLVQGLLMWVISIPVLVHHFYASRSGLSVLDFIGIAIWGIGFFFESVGDWQLSRFKADPANRWKLLTTGLWQYTRHPNYFGDAAQWWGFYLFATSVGGWWTAYSPLLMTWLLRRVSGVTLLEKSLRDTKPGFEEYAASTNAFFPWFPKKRG